jgi:hypothetical protein
MSLNALAESFEVRPQHDDPVYLLALRGLRVCRTAKFQFELSVRQQFSPVTMKLLAVFVRNRTDSYKLAILNYRHGPSQTTDLPRLRGLSDPRPASRRRRQAHIPVP